MNKYKIKVNKSNHQEVQQLFIDLGYNGVLDTREVVSHPFINLGVKPMPEVSYIMANSDGSMIIADATSNFWFEESDAQLISIENLKSFVGSKAVRKELSFSYSNTNQYNVIANKLTTKDHPKRDLAFIVPCKGASHE
ncbi:hypothetical protein ACSOTD_07555 [Acinetobacter baumannii]|uniref:hypothetical protein n=1 Tax=Acinetobacter baumannii TaxID=470 RepID=UPI003F1C54BB